MPGRSDDRKGDSGGEMAELMAMRARDGETDLANVVALLRAVAIEHLKACCSRSIHLGHAISASHPLVLDAAAWLSELRGEDEREIARRITRGLENGVAAIFRGSAAG